MLPASKQNPQPGKCKDICQGGMLFKTMSHVPRKTYVLLDIDFAKLGEWIEIENDLILIGGKILGKVVRTHLNLDNGLFEIGIQFVRESEGGGEELRDLLHRVNEVSTPNHRLVKQK